MAKLTFQATGLQVEVSEDRVEQMKKHGFVEATNARTPKKTGVKNESKSK